MKLVDVKNNPRSVVELYLSEDRSEIMELKCLSGNRCKEYRYPISDYMGMEGVSRQIKNKIAIALSQV